MSSNTTRRERMAALAAEHVRAEDAGDVDATLATFQSEAAFELFPCGLRLSGHDRIRRYYEYFFSTSLKRCAGYTTRGTQEGDDGMAVEMTVTLSYPGGSTRDFRVLTIFPYGETALLGERIYADTEFFRVIFGPLLAEAEPMPD